MVKREEAPGTDVMFPNGFVPGTNRLLLMLVKKILFWFAPVTARWFSCLPAGCVNGGAELPAGISVEMALFSSDQCVCRNKLKAVATATGSMVIPSSS